MNEDQLKDQINELIKDEIQESINEYVDAKELTKKSGLGFVEPTDEQQLKLSIYRG